MWEGIWLHCCMKDPNNIAVWKNMTTLCVKSPHTTVWRNLTTLVWRSHPALMCEGIWQYCWMNKSLHVAVWRILTKLLYEEVTPHCCVKESDFTVVLSSHPTLMCEEVKPDCCVKSIYNAGLTVHLVVCYDVLGFTLPQACAAGPYSRDLEPLHCRSPSTTLSPRIWWQTGGRQQSDECGKYGICTLFTIHSE